MILQMFSFIVQGSPGSPGEPGPKGEMGSLVSQRIFFLFISEPTLVKFAFYSFSTSVKFNLQPSFCFFLKHRQKYILNQA